MKRQSKEEKIELDRESKISKPSKIDIFQMDKVLNQMQTTYRANIQAQQCYIDILKKKNKNINSNYIKSIYALFTQNKANQICFEKQQHSFINAELDDRLLRRYYARLIQMGIRRISYFWMNFTSLQFLTSYIVKFTREVQSLFNDIYKLKTLDQHYTIMKMLYHQNAIIEQKIYQLLIDEGYLFSMDQFYRINGVDLVADRLYEGNSAKSHTQTSSFQHSQSQIQSKKQSLKLINFTKKLKQRAEKKWGYSRPSAERLVSSLPQPQIQKNKSKIKNMLESMVNVLKNSLDQPVEEVNRLQVIQQQNYGNPKSQRDNIWEPAQETLSKMASYRKRVSKPQNIFIPDYKKKVYQKKLSIELVSYFSNEMKSAISDVQAIDIDCLSQLLMASQSNSNQNKFHAVNQKQQPYIHSVQSLESLNRIKQQRKRGRFIQMAIKKQNIQSLSQMYDQVFEGYNNFNYKKDTMKQKFSFRSAPGMYISIPKKKQQFIKISNKSTKKNSRNHKKWIIRQQLPRNHLFENQLIVSELATRHISNYANHINYTQVNGNNLQCGIMNPKACSEALSEHSNNQIFHFKDRFNKNIHPLLQRATNKSQNKKYIKIKVNTLREFQCRLVYNHDKLKQNESKIVNQIQYKTNQFKNTQAQQNLNVQYPYNHKQYKQFNENMFQKQKQIRNDKQRLYSTVARQSAEKQSRFIYTVYDRMRRRIVAMR